MYREEFVEEGIVSEVINGIATINVADTGGCQECSAKIFCKPNDNDKRKITAKDPYGVLPGDKVRIAIKGRSVLAASFILYGVPLILLVAGIFFGMNFFSNNVELYSTLLGIGLISLYSAGVMVYSKLKNISSKLIPEIIFVSRLSPHS